MTITRIFIIDVHDVVSSSAYGFEKRVILLIYLYLTCSKLTTETLEQACSSVYY